MSRLVETFLIIAVTAGIVGGVMTQWSGASATLPDQMFSNGSFAIAAGPPEVTTRDVAPGQAVGGSLVVTNTGDIEGRYALGTTAPRDRLDGAGADLGRALRLTIIDVTLPRAPRVVYSGTVGDLEAVDLGVFAPGDVHTYRFTAVYPTAAASDGPRAPSVASPSFVWTAVRVG